MSSPTISEIDLAARSFWEQSPDERDRAFAVLRRETPVSWSRPAESDLLPAEENTRGFWSLTKYKDIQFASRNPRIFSSAGGITMEDFSPEMTEVAQSFIAMDDPRHAQCALGALANEAGITLVQMAIAFVTHHPAVTSAIVGPRTMEHLESHLAADGVLLSDDMLDRIDEIVAPGQTVNVADNMWSTSTTALDAASRRGA